MYEVEASLKTFSLLSDDGDICQGEPGHPHTPQFVLYAVLQVKFCQMIPFELKKMPDVVKILDFSTKLTPLCSPVG